MPAARLVDAGQEFLSLPESRTRDDARDDGLCGRELLCNHVDCQYVSNYVYRRSSHRALPPAKGNQRYAGEGLFICEGDKLVRRLIDSHFQVASLLVAERWVDQYADIDACFPVFVVPDDWIESIVGFNFHRGVLACGRRRTAPALDSFCDSLGEQATLAVCPDVQDPDNLGTILRIASAFGVDAVVAGNKTADPFSRRVLRVSMGASLRIPTLFSKDVLGDLAILRERWRFESWATVLDTKAVVLERQARPRRLALLFGSEGHGLEPELIEACDRVVTIPMTPGVDSLNVAVAAGIFFYEVMRPGRCDGVLDTEAAFGDSVSPPR